MNLIEKQDTVMLEKLAQIDFLSIEKWIWHHFFVTIHLNMSLIKIRNLIKI